MFTRLLAPTLRHLSAAFDADTCSLVMADWATGTLVVRAAYGFGRDARTRVSFPRRLGEGISSFVISHGQPLLLTDPARERRLKGVSFKPRADVSSSLCLPVSVNGSLAGALNLTRKAGMHAFSRQDLVQALALVEWLKPCVVQATRAAAAGPSRQAPLMPLLRRHVQDANLVFATVRRLNSAITARQVLDCMRGAVRRVLGAAQQRYILLDGQDTAALRQALGALGGPCWMNGSRPRVLASGLGIQPGSHALVVPLKHGGARAACLIEDVERKPDPQRMHLLAALAAATAAALKRAASYQRVVGGRRVTLSTVSGAYWSGWQAGAPRSLPRYLISLAKAVMPFESAVIQMRRSADGKLRKHWGSGKPWRLAPWEREAMQWAAMHRRPLLANGRAGGKSLAAVPLAVGHRVLGVMALRGGSAPFSAHQAAAVTALACQAAAAARALSDARRASRHADDVLRSLLAGVIGTDQRGRVVVFSPPAEQTLRFPASEAVGRPFEDVLEEIGNRSGWRGVSILSHIAAQAASGHSNGKRQEIAMGDSPLRALHLSVGCSPVRTPSGERDGAVLVVEDITARKRAEARAAQVRQLAALGQMAANVAHEVRNPLSAIKTAAQLLAEEAPNGSASEELANIVNEECDRLGKLTDDFLTYARPQEPQTGPVNVSQVARRCLRLTAALLARHQIVAAARFGRALPPVAADPEQLAQVLLNLITNAAQEMSSGGRLQISARAVSSGKRAQVEIAVSDTGPGIPAEHLGHIFDPFFTTKVRGTGLGLAIARQIVAVHSGRIEAHSQQGKGAVITVRLPVYRARSSDNGGSDNGAAR